MKNKTPEDKLLVAVINDYDGNGTKCFMEIEDDIDWHDVKEQITNNLEFSQSTAIKFIFRTRKWLDKLPIID